MTDADPALTGVRLVATDLDGTVVRRDGTISARTVAALAAVEDAGLHLVFVTGRPPRWMRPISEATGHHGIAVCGNGAFVYDLHAERVVERFALEPAEGAEAVRRIRAVLPGAAFAVETGWGFGHEPAYEPNWPTPDLTRVVPVEDLVSEPVGKLLVRLKGSDGDAMLEAVAPVLSGLAEATHSNSGDCLLEVSARGVSKASTLARVCAEHGVAAHEVLAFGDQPNDLPMLAWAGLAYAVANAHPLVLASGARRTASIDEDGVAQVLETLPALRG